MRKDILARADEIRARAYLNKYKKDIMAVFTNIVSLEFGEFIEKPLVSREELREVNSYEHIPFSAITIYTSQEVILRWVDFCVRSAGIKEGFFFKNGISEELPWATVKIKEQDWIAPVWEQFKGSFGFLILKQSAERWLHFSGWENHYAANIGKPNSRTQDEPQKPWEQVSNYKEYVLKILADVNSLEFIEFVETNLSFFDRLPEIDKLYVERRWFCDLSRPASPETALTWANFCITLTAIEESFFIKIGGSYDDPWTRVKIRNQDWVPQLWNQFKNNFSFNLVNKDETIWLRLAGETNQYTARLTPRMEL